MHHNKKNIKQHYTTDLNMNNNNKNNNKMFLKQPISKLLNNWMIEMISERSCDTGVMAVEIYVYKLHKIYI